MGNILPRGLATDILEIVVAKRLEDMHGVGTATSMAIESLNPFRATMEAIDQNGIWVHVYFIVQKGEDLFLEMKETREEAKKPIQKNGTNLGYLLQAALAKKGK